MAVTTRYSDTVRQQAVALSREGKGYKAIASALGVPRDTVRSWVQSYRLTGRTESVHTTGQLRPMEEREALYAKAREEYENSSTPLRTIAQRHGLNYFNLRYFLQQYHPESALLHGYAKRSAALQAALDAQLASLQQTGEQLLRQLKEDLDGQLLRIRG